MKSIGKKVVGQLGQLGKKIGTETVKAPVEIAKAAVEGSKSAKGPSGVIMEKGVPKKSELSSGPWSNIDREKDQKKKAAIARAALKEFAKKPIRKEPSVYERIQQEQLQKKQMLAKQQMQQRMAKLPEIKGKDKRGTAFAHKKLRKKQTGTETKVNIKTG